MKQAKHHLVGEAEAIRGQVFQAVDHYLRGQAMQDDFAALLAPKNADQADT